MLVSRIGVSDAEALRDIRLEALMRHPEAFSRDLEMESALSSGEWRTTIAERAWFVCRDDDRWAGIAAFARNRASKKTAHVGSLGAMYVRNAWRGKGAGDKLVMAVIAHAAGEVEQLVLTVNAENGPAIALYERHRFAVYGRIPRSIKIGERYYDELEMIRVELP